MDDLNNSGGAVREIASLAQKAAAAVVKIDGKDYSTVSLHDPREAESEPKPIKVATLESLVEFLKAKRDTSYTSPRGLFLHVAGPDEVRALTGIFGEKNQRVTVVVAQAMVPQIPFGSFSDPEAFSILLQTHFEETTERAKVLALIGNLTEEKVQTSSDDGVSQSVTARAGIVKRTELAVPNPVTLRPFRTFAEIAQPESKFILRLRGGGDERLPTCALFEADGGAWRLQAVARIKAFLKSETTGVGSSVEVYG